MEIDILKEQMETSMPGRSAKMGTCTSGNRADFHQSWVYFYLYFFIYVAVTILNEDEQN